MNDLATDPKVHIGMIANRWLDSELTLVESRSRIQILTGCSPAVADDVLRAALDRFATRFGTPEHEAADAKLRAAVDRAVNP